MPSYIITDKSSTAARIREVLNFGGHDCPASHVLPIDAAAGRLGRESDVDLVVIALSPDLERGLGLLPAVSRLAPGKVLAVGPSGNAKAVLHALRAGADDYVDSIELESELGGAIDRLRDAGKGAAEVGRLTAVLGPSGGSGASTLAANLAAALAKKNLTTSLIDLKLDNGDLTALLDLKPSFTLADLCRNVARLDKVMFDRSLVKHDSGVALLAAPTHLDDAGQVRPEGIAQALNLARAGFAHVVADLDRTFREEQRVVLRQADTILVVIRLEFAALRNARRALEQIERLDVPADRVQLVVNRYGQPQEVPAAKAEDALGRKITHYLPEDAKAINRANNQGAPIVVSAPSARFAKAVVQIATKLAAPAPAAAPVAARK